MFKQNWLDHGIVYVNDLFDTLKSFPVAYREFNLVTKAIPDRLCLLMINHLTFQEALRIEPLLMINGVDITNPKCNNKLYKMHFMTENISKGEDLLGHHLY